MRSKDKPIDIADLTEAMGDIGKFYGGTCSYIEDLDKNPLKVANFFATGISSNTMRELMKELTFLQ